MVELVATSQDLPGNRARPGWWRRQRHWAIAVASLALAACSTPPAEPVAGSTGGPSAAAPTDPATTTLPADLTAMLLPVTGAEARWAQGLSTYSDSVAYASAQACVRSQAVAMPDVPPPMFVRFYDLPDLAFIRLRGFGSTDTQSPVGVVASGAASPGPAARADADVQKRCLEQGRTSVAPLRTLVNPLQGRWLAQSASVGRDARVVTAYQALPGCLRGRGLKVRDENEFFSVLDSRLHAVEGKPEAVQVERQLAADYATCMAPVESVREDIRRELREQFHKRHASEIRSVVQALVPRIRQLEASSGIPISFPSP